MSTSIPETTYNKIHQIIKENPTLSNEKIGQKLGIGKDAVRKWRARPEYPSIDEPTLITLEEDSRCRAENKELKRRLNEAIARETKHRDIFRLHSKAVDLQLDPPAWMRKATNDTDKAIATAFLSDLHLDEVVLPEQVQGVNAYNRKIAEARLRKFFESTLQLTFDHMKGISIEGLILPMGGDMFSGNIHEELKITNEATILESILHWSELLTAGVRILAAEFKKVHIPCVVGNHGRQSHKPIAKNRAQDNFDWLLYHMIARELAGERNVTFDISEAADTMFQIYETTFLLTHGDQFKGGGGIAGLLSPLMIGAHRKSKRQTAIGKPFNHMVCVTQDTEALTRDGWKRYTEILPDDEIATLNPKTDAFQWQEQRINEFDYSGPVCHYTGDYFDHIVTPDHRMWTRTETNSEWRYVVAQKVSTQRWFARLAGTVWEGEPPVLDIPVYGTQLDLAELFGWYISEGSVAENRRLEIAQSRAANPEKYVRIDALLTRLGLTVSYDPLKLRVCNAAVARWIETNIGTGCTAKKIPTWLRNAPKDYLTRFMESAILGDGCTQSPSSWQYYTSSNDIADSIQEIAIKLGWSALKSSRQREGRNYPSYCISMTPRNTCRMPNKPPQAIAYSGRVWCPTVPNGLWFARRGGRPFVTGNCGHWHQYSAFKGVIVNGSLKGYDEYASINNFDYEPPRQAYWLTQPKHGITISGPLHVLGKNERYS